MRVELHISSMILFSLVRRTLDMMSNELLESVNMCTGIGGLNMSSHCLRIANASSNGSSKAFTSADNRENATDRDLYDLYETGIEW